jgi:hypothetical protein
MALPLRGTLALKKKKRRRRKKVENKIIKTIAIYGNPI